MSTKKSFIRTSRGIPRPYSARSDKSEINFEKIKPGNQEEKILKVDPNTENINKSPASPKICSLSDPMYVLFLFS